MAFLRHLLELSLFWDADSHMDAGFPLLVQRASNRLLGGICHNEAQITIVRTTVSIEFFDTVELF
jgi:hypothetical protein